MCCGWHAVVALGCAGGGQSPCSGCARTSQTAAGAACPPSPVERMHRSEERQRNTIASRATTSGGGVMPVQTTHLVAGVVVHQIWLRALWLHRLLQLLLLFLRLHRGHPLIACPRILPARKLPLRGRLRTGRRCCCRIGLPHRWREVALGQLRTRCLRYPFRRFHPPQCWEVLCGRSRGRGLPKGPRDQDMGLAAGLKPSFGTRNTHRNSTDQLGVGCSRTTVCRPWAWSAGRAGEGRRTCTAAAALPAELLPAMRSAIVSAAPPAGAPACVTRGRLSGDRERGAMPWQDHLPINGPSMGSCFDSWPRRADRQLL